MTERVLIADQIAALEDCQSAARTALAFVGTVKRSQADIDAIMTRYAAAIATLRWVEAHEAEIRDDVRNARP